MFRLKLITTLIHYNELLIFYPRLAKFYKSAINKKDPVILDVGSNKGQTIDFFLKHFSKARIYGFEPNRKLVEKYKKYPNVSIANIGVSDQSGKLLFKETVTDETSTFEELNYDSEYLKMKARVLGVDPRNIVKKSYEVDVTTLADFIKNNKIGNIDVIKIDTEGHEYKCLVGLFKGDKLSASFIQLEQHNDDMYANKASEETISSFLATHNFSLFSRIKHGFGDFDEVIYKIAK